MLFNILLVQFLDTNYILLYLKINRLQKSYNLENNYFYLELSMKQGSLL